VREPATCPRFEHVAGGSHSKAAREKLSQGWADALDLCDVLSSFAPHTKASLDELSRIMGLPGKPDSIDGTEVERYLMGRSKRSQITARTMSSTPIAFGCDTSCFEAS
jgi:hypothetical protein